MEGRKDFNFLDSLPKGDWNPRNTLPPKYKYFVVQQFFKPKPWFGFKKHPTIKTCRFYVMQFFTCESVRFTSKKHPI